MTKLFDLPGSGVTQSAGYEEDGKIITTENIDPAALKTIMDSNRQRENPLKQKKNDMGVVGARIPITVYHNFREQWRAGPRLWGEPWHVFLKKQLNSAECKDMRFMNL